MKCANFIFPPRKIMAHTPEVVLTGQDVYRQENGELWLFNCYGRQQADFSVPLKTDPSAVADVLISRDGGRSFTPSDIEVPYPLDGGINGGGRSVLRLQDGRLCLVTHRFADALKASGSNGIPAISFSSDDGKTWTPYRKLVEQESRCFVMNQRLVQLPNGRLVLPVSPADPELPEGQFAEGGSPTVSACFYSDDAGETWRLGKTVRINNQRGMQEPTVAAIGGNRMVMLARSGTGFHQICFSEDNGEHWSEPKDTTLQAACSALTLTTLPDGRLLVAYEHCAPMSRESYFPRSPLCYAVSADGGLTWSEPVCVDDTVATIGYPSVTVTPEGLLIVYGMEVPLDDSWKVPPEAWKFGGLMSCMVAYPD